MQNGSDAVISGEVDYRSIRVFDGCGNELQPTYRKRAKGLVKHGRAQWCGVEQDSIVLTDTTSMPQGLRTADHIITEDTQMSEYRENEIIENEIIENEETNKTLNDYDDGCILASEAENMSNEKALDNLLLILAKLVSDIKGVQDEAQMQCIVSMYKETLYLIKDITKQNQEVKLAELKCNSEKN